MAAKVIRVSDDGGMTWENLPGSQGSFNSEAESVDDTILGQTFSSSDIGLVGWSVSSDGIFKGFSGYLAEIKKIGSATIANGEAMSLESGKIYAINDAAKEIWDRSDTVVVYDGMSDETANVEWVDYLFGRVKFLDSYTVSGAVTVDVSYFPTAAAGKANAYNLTMTAEAIDETDFATAQGNSGTRIFRPGLRNVALELTGIFDDTENYKSDLAARTELIIEIDPAGDGSSIARGFFKLVNTGQSGAVGALEEETVNFNLTVPDETAGPAIEIPFNWRHTNTTLSPAIQHLITSWIGELNTYDVQYLPQGSPGQSPLDGVQGNFIVTDLSLSGGLSNMNVFTAELQGTGQFTEV